MKRKLIIVITLLFSFTFIANISAKTCKYNTIQVTYKSNSHTDYSECEKNVDVYGKSCEIHNKGALLNTNISLDFSNDKIDISFPTRKDTNGNIGETKTLTKIDVANNVSSSEFHFADKCPKWLLIRTGVNGSASSGEAKGYYEFSKDQATGDIKSFISGNNWKNQSFFFIGEKIEDSSGGEEEDNTHTSCKQFTSEGKNVCEHNDEFSCVWVDKKSNGKDWSYCNFDNLRYVSCGSVMDLPTNLPSITSMLVNMLKILTPIILIFVSVISLIKAISSSKEEDIKKAQNKLVKRLIAAALVFFIIQITQFVMLKVSDNADHGDMRACFSCLLNNSCQANIYYKTQDAHANVDGKRYECTYQNGDTTYCY